MVCVLVSCIYDVKLGLHNSVHKRQDWGRRTRNLDIEAFTALWERFPRPHLRSPPAPKATPPHFGLLGSGCCEAAIVSILMKVEASLANQVKFSGHSAPKHEADLDAKVKHSLSAPASCYTRSQTISNDTPATSYYINTA